MRTIGQDFRYGLRSLRRTPGFSLVAILTLALGIGVNTVIFSLIHAVLLRPLPVEEPERLVALKWGTREYPYGPFSYPLYSELRDRSAVFSGLAAHTPTWMHLSSGDQTERVFGELVSGNYFDVLGVVPATGRGFLPEDDRPSEGRPVAVISYRTWKRHFASAAEVVGKDIRINGHLFTVVGVAPKAFTGLTLDRQADLWVPLSMASRARPDVAGWLSEPQNLWLSVVGRLQEGTTLEQAESHLAVLVKQLERDSPASSRGRRVTLLEDLRLSPSFKRRSQIYLGLLMGAALLVLLIACSNVASLLLARSATRRRELALRRALGSSTVRLARSLLVESTLLASAGGLAGLVLAVLGFHVLRLVRLPGNASLAEVGLGLEPRVLLFSLAVSLGTGVLFGLAPLFHAGRTALLPALKETGEGRASRRSGPQRALVGFQVALSVLLLVVAGLFIRSLRNLQGTDIGFDHRNVLTAAVDLERQGYSPEEGRVFFLELLDRAAGLPGVESASLAQSVPVTPDMMAGPVYVEGRAESQSVEFNSVGPGYFHTMRIPLLRGRDFERRDVSEGPLVAIINEAGARAFWPGQDPVGKQIRLFRPDDPPRVIVGVARDISYHDVRTRQLDSGNSPAYVYLPALQLDRRILAVLLRTAEVDPGALVPLLRREIRELDRALPVFDLMTLEDRLDLALSAERAGTGLLSIFGVLAVILATVGLFGVASYSVAQRTREIGIRMALGADRAKVLRMVMAQGLKITLLGVFVGLLAAYGVTRFLAAMLYGVNPADLATFVAVALILVLATLLATLAPATRAASADPTKTLRHE